MSFCKKLAFTPTRLHDCTRAVAHFLCAAHKIRVAPSIIYDAASAALGAAANAMSGGPKPQAMRRDDGPAPAEFIGRRGMCFGLCPGGRVTTPIAFNQATRQERVFYDSAKANRTCLGACHYCISCPGWSKATDMRVVYSTWNLVPLDKMPSECFKCCCDCGGSQADWLPPPNPKEFKSNTRQRPGGEGGDGAAAPCCQWACPCGRTLDHFDADIIVDASAHQTLCQICRNEGDVILYRKAGADLSDPSEVFLMCAPALSRPRARCTPFVPLSHAHANPRPPPPPPLFAAPLCVLI